MIATSDEPAPVSGPQGGRIAWDGESSTAGCHAAPTPRARQRWIFGIVRR